MGIDFTEIIENNIKDKEKSENEISIEITNKKEKNEKNKNNENSKYIKNLFIENPIDTININNNKYENSNTVKLY